MRRTLALAGVAVLGVTGLAGPASADPGAGIMTHLVAIEQIGVDLVNAGPSNNIDGSFVLLVNRSGADLELDGFEVHGCDATNSMFKITTVPNDTTILSGGTFLIADDNYAAGGGPARDRAFDANANLVHAEGGVLVEDDLDVAQDDVRWDSPADVTCASFNPTPTSVIPNNTESLNQNFTNDTWELAEPTL